MFWLKVVSVLTDHMQVVAVQRKNWHVILRKNCRRVAATIVMLNTSDRRHQLNLVADLRKLVPRLADIRRVRRPRNSSASEGK